MQHLLTVDISFHARHFMNPHFFFPQNICELSLCGLLSSVPLLVKNSFFFSQLPNVTVSRMALASYSNPPLWAPAPAAFHFNMFTNQFFEFRDTHTRTHSMRPKLLLHLKIKASLVIIVVIIIFQLAPTWRMADNVHMFFFLRLLLPPDKVDKSSFPQC